jgi:hypothetical protein
MEAEYRKINLIFEDANAATATTFVINGAIQSAETSCGGISGRPLPVGVGRSANGSFPGAFRKMCWNPSRASLRSGNCPNIPQDCPKWIGTGGTPRGRLCGRRAGVSPCRRQSSLLTQTLQASLRDFMSSIPAHPRLKPWAIFVPSLRDKPMPGDNRGGWSKDDTAAVLGEPRCSQASRFAQRLRGTSRRDRMWLTWNAFSQGRPTL